MATDQDLLEDAKEQFEECVQAESENRTEALDDLRFARLAEQWPEAIKKQREREGRPCLTINRLPSFIRQVVNDARQNKPSIKTKPVDDLADAETAEVLNDLIRNIEHISSADAAYDTAVDFAVSCGLGYLRVDIDYAHDDTFDMDLLIGRVANPFSIYGDPHSEAVDSSDWMRAFVVDRMTRNAFRKKWKGADEVDWDALGYTKLGEPWAGDSTIQVAEWWLREEITKTLLRLSDGSIVDEARFLKLKDYYDAVGVTVTGDRPSKSWKVKQRIMTGAEILEENDWPGIYIPIIPVYGDEVNVDGKRVFRSLIRDAKDPQRMLNYWRTTGTELVALAPRVPFIGPKGAFNTDAQKWATANTTSHPFIEYDGSIPPQRQPLDTGGAAGAMQEAMAATDDLKSIMGLYDASLGAKSNETSGRAIIARQREGDNSTFHFIDNMSRAIRHLGRIVVDLIPHVYSQPRILRVIGEDGNSRNVAVNQPQTVGQQSPQQAAVQQAMNRHANQAIAKVYDLTVGRYDVVVQSGPSFTTKRDEAVTQMTELMRVYPPAAPLIGDMLAKNLDWPGAEEISQRFRAMLPPQIQGQNPQVQALQQQMQAMDQHAKQAVATLQQQLQEAQQKLAVNDSKATYEFQKLEIERYKAETDRIEALVSAAGAGDQLAAQAVMQMRAEMPYVAQQPVAMPPGPMPPPQQATPVPNQPPPGGFFTPGDGQITNQ